MRPVSLRVAGSLVAAVAVLAGCHGSEALVGPIGPDPVPDLGSRSVTLTAEGAPAEYMAVVSNTVLDGTTRSSFTIRGDGLVASVARLPDSGAGALLDVGAVGGSQPLQRDEAFENRLRERERAELTGRIAAAQEWFAGRAAPAPAPSAGIAPGVRSAQAIPAGTKVGDVLRVNVNGDSACSAPVYHPARVAAIGQRAMILEDTLDPKGGFTDADYRRFAARFDTLVFPLDSTAFGAPTDIDNNGHIALVFTRSVNEATARNASSYIAGFTFSRDLFPITGTSRLTACAGSNEGEYFYLLAPDPFGTINGNARTTSFVDSITTAVIAHEFQHLINSGRRLYVNLAPKFEERWLDEGLAHEAEELLFYRESGLRPSSNIDAGMLRTTSRILYAYNRDMSGNQGRYRSYLGDPAHGSPVGRNDDLATRGAAWSLLRYLSDRAGTDGAVFYQLANARTTGVENLVGVFGAGVASSVRDWNVSHAVDDLVSTPLYQQPSWNWHSIYSNLGSGMQYPLQYQPMTSGTSYSGSVLSGGAAYFKITVPANSSATVSLVESGASSTLSLVTVRTK